MSETPKRLKPTADVSRELYLRSGNECAYPDCNERIIDSNGSYTGNLCHIEGALPRSPRFNPDQSNEDRRSYGNLMLMCRNHHIETDDSAEFPVSRLQEIKAEHERKFSEIERSICEDISDHTSEDAPRESASLTRLNTTFRNRLNNDQLRPLISDINEFARKIQSIPRPTRQLLSIMAQRSHGGRTAEVPLREIESATGRTPETLMGHIDTLQRAGITSGPYEDSYGLPILDLLNLDGGWNIWHDLKVFADTTGIKLDQIITELRFDLLD